MTDAHIKQTGVRSLFFDEKRLMDRVASLLKEHCDDPDKLTSHLSMLLVAHQKLHRQMERLNRINDRTQLALRQSEKSLHDALIEVGSQREMLMHEQNLVEKIITKMRASVVLDLKGLRYVNTSVGRTGGDLIFSTRRPDGVRHVLLGDITGHGLPAAIIGPLVSDIFHTMTHKGFSCAVILEEINRSLRKKLPTGTYLAAAILEWDPELSHFFIWNGGMPEILIFHNAAVRHRVPSGNFPLGIVDNDTLQSRRVSLHLDAGDRLFLHSDGIIESSTPMGESYGSERFENWLVTLLTHHDLPLESLTKELDVFRCGRLQDDDITLIEVSV
jgi:hypothetical protein